MKKKLTRYFLIIIASSIILVSGCIYLASFYYSGLLKDSIINDTHRSIASRLNEYDMLMFEIEKRMDLKIEQELPGLATELLASKNDLNNLSQRDMKALLNKYGFNDLYLIDQDGLIFNTTFEPDLNFNLRKISKTFNRFLQEILNQGIVQTERISISSKTGTIKKYAYYSPIDSDIIIEVSISLQEYISMYFSEALGGYLSGDLFQEVADNSSFIIELDIYSVNPVGQWSLIREETQMSDEIYEMVKNKRPFTIENNGFVESYYPSAFRVVKSSVPEDDLWIKIVFDFSSIHVHQRMILIISIVIAMLSIVITYFIVSGYIGKNIIDRITVINHALNRIASGSREEKLDLTEKDELTKISNNILFMQRQIDEKEKAIIDINDDLESIVEKRTMALSREIKSHKDTVVQLQDAIITSEAANRSKNEFLTNVSHEIQTPLNAVIGFAEILLAEEENHEKREKLEAINSSGKQLMNIVNTILDFSKIETHTLHIEKHIINLPRLLRSVFDMHKEIAQAKGIEYDLYISRNVPEIAVGDDGRISQVIWNLLSNAIKFTSSGFVLMKCDYEDGWLDVKIEDSGIGISEMDREKIFAAFEQLSKSTTRRYRGTGLGLTICARLVELMGGMISVNSQPGKGSVFSFKVNIKPEE